MIRTPFHVSRRGKRIDRVVVTSIAGNDRHLMSGAGEFNRQIGQVLRRRGDVRIETLIE